MASVSNRVEMTYVEKGKEESMKIHYFQNLPSIEDIENRINYK